MTNQINIEWWQKYAWSSPKPKNTTELPPFINLPSCAEIEVHPEMNASTVKHLNELYEANSID